MPVNISWSVEARIDFEYYVDYYIEQAGRKIAIDFINCIKASEQKIKNNPRIARKSKDIDELREYVLQKYPFLISYWIKNQETIIITSFLHAKRKK